METEGRDVVVDLVVIGTPGEHRTAEVPLRAGGRFTPMLLLVIAPAADLQVSYLFAGQRRCDLRERWPERWASQGWREYVIEVDGKVGGPIMVSPLSLLLQVKFGEHGGQFQVKVFGKLMQP